MDTSTQQGDALDTDSAAALLNERALKREAVDEKPEVIEDVTEEVTEEITEDDEEVTEIEATQESEEVEEDAPTEEAATFETIAELAEAVDMPLDEFLESVKITTKVNGDESEVSLAELRKGYQLEADYTRKNQEFVESKKAFDEQQEAARAEITEQMQRTGAAFQLAQSQLTNEFNSINWDELQKTDPTNYVISRQKFGERQAQINQAIDQATREAQAFQAKQIEEAEQAKQSTIAKEAELLEKALPAWKDLKVRNEQSSKVGEYLASIGYQPDEINGITDHRIVLMAVKAMSALDESQIDIAKKKVQKVPKIVKGNARQNQTQSKAKIAQKLRDKVRRTGSVDDVAALLIQRRA